MQMYRIIHYLSYYRLFDEAVNNKLLIPTSASPLLTGAVAIGWFVAAKGGVESRMGSLSRSIENAI